MSKFIKLSDVKEQKLKEEEMKKTKGGFHLLYGIIPPIVLDYGIIPDPY